MALPPRSDFGPCACGGQFEPRTVEVRMTVDGEIIVIEDVPQGACSNCGSRVYKARVLEEIEATMRGDRPRAIV
jgi:YgiT-type zinc finger domain-containing protein